MLEKIEIREAEKLPTNEKNTKKCQKMSKNIKKQPKSRHPTKKHGALEIVNDTKFKKIKKNQKMSKNVKKKK
jgi:hypothetical protein